MLCNRVLLSNLSNSFLRTTVSAAKRIYADTTLQRTLLIANAMGRIQTTIALQVGFYTYVLSLAEKKMNE